MVVSAEGGRHRGLTCVKSCVFVLSNTVSVRGNGVRNREAVARLCSGVRVTTTPFVMVAVALS